MKKYTPSLVLATLFLAALTPVSSWAEDSLEVSSMVIRLVEQVDTPARESGALAVVNVAEGQLVNSGHVLARIEDTEAALAVERTKLELDIARRNAENDIGIRFARKSLDVARAELQRCVESIRKSPRSISESEMDRLRLLVEKGSVEVEQAQRDFASAASSQKIKENDCKAAQEKLDRHRILAPIGGVVVRAYRNRGEWVKPGEPVVRILRLDRLRAEGFLNSRDLPADLQHCVVKLRVDLPGDPGHEFSAKIAFVDPEIDPVNSQVRVWAEFQNADLRVRPGMQAKMIVARRPKP
jgi:multidrug efflux pump subunit AcrA (membrane-fusion protein)